MDKNKGVPVNIWFFNPKEDIVAPSDTTSQFTCNINFSNGEYVHMAKIQIHSPSSNEGERVAKIITGLMNALEQPYQVMLRKKDK